MQASLYPSPSPSPSTATIAAAAATTPARSRASASPACGRQRSPRPNVCTRGSWLFGDTRAFLGSSSPRSFSVCRALPAVVECKVPNIPQERFPDEVLKSDSPVLVGFCADWCGPCKLIGPVIDSVAKDLNGSLKAVKIDVDTSPDLVKEYDVYGLPTIIVFKDGKEVPNSRKEGAMNAKKLKALLDQVLSTIASP